MFCKNCGQELINGIDKCPSCNYRTDENSQNETHTGQGPDNINNMNTGNGCAVVLMLVLVLIFGYAGFRILFGSLGQLGFNKTDLMSSFEESWNNNDFWD